MKVMCGVVDGSLCVFKQTFTIGFVPVRTASKTHMQHRMYNVQFQFFDQFELAYLKLTKYAYVDKKVIPV